MDSFELNKIAAAVLFSLLLVLGISNAAGIIYSPKKLAEQAYKVPGVEEAAAPPAPPVRPPQPTRRSQSSWPPPSRRTAPTFSRSAPPVTGSRRAGPTRSAPTSMA